MATDDIMEFTAGFDAESFAASRLVQHAVERQPITVGEASAKLRRDFPAIADRVPDLPQIIDMRHVLVHGYRTVNLNMIWLVVADSLHPPRAQLAALIAELDA